MSIHDETSLSLIEGLAKGKDQEAWKRFLNIYSPLMIRWNLNCGLQQYDAEDVAQEIIMYVFNNIDRFKRLRTGSFRKWLKTIATYKIRHIKRARKLVLLEEYSKYDFKEPQGSFEWGEDYYESIMQRGLEIIETKVKKSTWEAFLGVYIQNIDPEEVAKKLGISRNAVYIANGRILGRLKRILNKFMSFEME